jgi:uncharacterized damage-inducible protein DinB
MTTTIPSAHGSGGIGSSPSGASVESARLADQLERSVRGGAWHGPALLQAIAEVDATAATARPVDGSHTIHELVWHSAFWLDVARQRLADEAAAPLAPESDWPADEGAPEERWPAAIAWLEEAHRRLHAAVLVLPDERLDDPVSGSDPTVRGLLLGVLQHNAYHAGQIILLARATAGSPR